MTIQPGTGDVKYKDQYKGQNEDLGRGRRVDVVGAGFSGLVSAFFLSRSGFSVHVHEERASVGGLIQTLETQQGLVETAANGILNSALVEELFRQLDLPLASTHKASRKRFIFRNGKLKRWPLGPYASIRLLKFVLMAFALKSRVRPRPQETVAEWGLRVAGLECSTYLISTFTQGIYAGDPEKLSATLVFGHFFPERRLKQKKLKARGTVSARGGMGELIQRLRSHLEKNGVVFHFNQKYEGAGTQPKNPVVVATSAWQASEIMKNLNSPLAETLRQVDMLPLVSATAFFNQTDVSSKGFGFLFPPIVNRQVLGVLKNDFIFSGRAVNGLHSETWIMGGALNRKIVESSDEEVLRIIMTERQRLFAIDEKPVGYKITRWPNAIPDYSIKLERLLPRLKEFESNTVLIGNYLGNIGLAKILEQALALPVKISIQGQWT
jgi:oxygen-dependent protoporphyrinogen oxidase